MKRNFKCLLVLLFLLSKVNISYSQNSIADEQSMSMLKQFYTNYNLVWSTTKNSRDLIKKIDSLRKIYCTIQLYDQLKKEFKKDGLDRDPLIKDEYTDALHINTLNVQKDRTMSNGYLVAYIDSTLSPSYTPIKKKVVLHVTVAKEADQYKIAMVH